MRSTLLELADLQPNRRLPIASMAKDMMQSGKELDAMEHGADLKHGVQPSEPSRGTGMLSYATCVGTSTVLGACMHSLCAVGLHPCCALRRAAWPDF